MEPPTTTPLLAVRGLRKTYGAFVALDDVSFTVNRGEILGLVGPNGAGKTTLLECVAGVRPRDAGTVEVDGHPVPPGTPGHGLFYLADGITPWAGERVARVLDFVEGYFGGTRAERQRVTDALHLEPLLAARMDTLSKGQRKRVLLALGLLVPARVVLCDEPFDGLDLRQTREVSAVLRASVAEGRTLFLSIHQVSDAARLCDRFVLLSHGRVCGEGTAGDLAARVPGTDPRALEEVVLALT